LSGDEMVTTATQLQIGNYLETFTSFEKSAAGHSVPWLRDLRRKGFARFCEVGFPTTKVEDWRFTNVAPIAQTDFRLPQGRAAAISKSAVAGFEFAGAAARLVFVDGRFAADASNVAGLPSGAKVTSLAKQIAEGPGEIETHLGRYLNIERDPFAALNTAFLEDGGYIHLRRGTVLEGPIHLLFVTTAANGPLVTHPRNLIVAENGTQATVIEDYVSLEPGAGFCNTATELIAGDDAVISHYMIERENKEAYNVSTLRIQQGRTANIASHSVLLGGALVRNNVHPVLAGEGGECLINGLFIGDGTQHLDNYMLVEHASPHCGSRQFYNGILDDQAHGVFHGRIIVHKDAQKTDAKQTNRNLLLSDEAQMDTKPQLEIFADDVKCTHGATIGQIEDNALFYLRSRGIDEASARRLLLLAFASECLDRMKEGAAREHVEGLIQRTLASLEVTKASKQATGSGAERERRWEEAG
jgi:Fe-S cluster assembly protein SufD